MVIECVEAGSVPFEVALGWQRQWVSKRLAGTIPDRILLLEHPPVVTMGRQDSRDDLRVSESFLKKQGIQLLKTDRGGRVTYHGPGQLVGYLVFLLKKEGVADFVHRIEEVLIRLLKDYHLDAVRDPQHPGVWVDDRKIAALGLHIDRHVTRHGFALNVTCDLTPYRYIHACGIREKGVTSMEQELGWRPLMRDVKHHLLTAAASVFGSRISLIGSVPTPPE